MNKRKSPAWKTIAILGTVWLICVNAAVSAQELDPLPPPAPIKQTVPPLPQVIPPPAQYPDSPPAALPIVPPPVKPDIPRVVQPAPVHVPKPDIPTVRPDAPSVMPAPGLQPSAPPLNHAEMDPPKARTIERLLPKSPPAFRPFKSKKRLPVEPGKADGLLIPLDHPGGKPRPLLQAMHNAPKLVVQKSGPPSGRVGQILEYQLVVRNPDGPEVRNVLIEDMIPEGTELLEAKPAGRILPRKIGWTIGTIRPGQELLFEVQLRCLGPGNLQMRSTASILFENTIQTKIQGVPVQLHVTTPSSVSVGQKVLFKIVVVNKSTQTLSGMLLTTQLPPAFKHPAGTDIEAELPPLKPDEKKVFDLEVDPVQAGRFRTDISLVTAARERVEVSRDILVKPNGPVQPLMVRKTGAPVLESGVVKEYRVEVKNQTAKTMSDVQIVDRLPKGFEVVAVSNNGSFDPNTGSVGWTLKEIRPGHVVAVGMRIKAAQSGKYGNPVMAQTNGHRAQLRAVLQVVEPPRAVGLPDGPR